MLSNQINASRLAAGHSVEVVELAERRLRGNSYLALKNVSCTCLDGILLLEGSLPTYYLKQLAQEVVADIDGVDQIVNNIEVAASSCCFADTDLCRSF